MPRPVPVVVFCDILALGICGYVAVNHLLFALATKPRRVHAWVCAWAACTALYLAARVVQFTTTSPTSAVASYRIALAVVFVLAFVVVGVAKAITDRPLATPVGWLIGVASGVAAVLAATTPLVATSSTFLNHDIWGDVFLDSRLGPAFPVLVPCAIGVFAYVTWLLSRAPQLTRHERGALLAGLSGYFALTLFDLGTIAGLYATTATFDIAFVPLTLAFHYELVLRVRELNSRLEALNSNLEGLVSGRTAELEMRTAQLAAANSELEAAARAKNVFLSRMSHELRTPLNSILGFAQRLELADLDDSSRSDVTHILTAGRHLLGLVDEVLEINRSELGGGEKRLVPVPIAAALEEAVGLVRPAADAAGVTIVCDSVEPGARVLADARRLRQVLLNILANAVTFNYRDGKVDVDVSQHRPGWLRVTVTDTGPGIAEADLDRIFEPFDRLGAEQAGIEGTGLGLTLCKHLVEEMEGTIGIESTFGAGTSVTVELPAAADLSS